MTALSLSEPLFATYVVAATLIILKAVSMSWLTVVRMMKENGGFRSPEDIRKTMFNPDPSPGQLERNDRVERIRRIQQNDLESLPYFLVAALIFVLDRAAAPPRPDPPLRLRGGAAAPLRRLPHRADPRHCGRCCGRPARSS